MRLILDKFRQHDHLELEFPETGLIKIDGPSGIGKSTIFDAIYEALTGEADDVVPWGESKAKVTLYWRDLEIVRTRGPVSLKLTEGDEVLRDEAAQARIYQVLGMNSQEISACAYVRQKMEGSLLSLTPGEQLKFVQDLALAGEDPEAIKERIKTIADATTLALKANEAVAVSYTERVADLQKKIANSSIPVAPTAPFSIDDAALVTKDETRLDAELRELRTKSREPYYFLVERAAGLKEHNDKLINENLKKIATLNSSLILGVWDDVEAHKVQNRLIAKRLYVDAKLKLQKAVVELKAKYPESGDRKISEFLVQERDRLLSEMTKASTRLADVNFKLRDLTKVDHVLECPACNAGLKFNGKVLITADKPVDHTEEKRTLEREKALIEAEHAKLKAPFDAMGASKVLCDQLVKEMGTDPEPAVKLETLVDSYDTYCAQKRHNSAIESEVSQLMTEIKRASDEDRRTAQTLAKYGEMPTFDELHQKILKAEGELIEARTKKVILEGLKDAWNRYNLASAQLRLHQEALVEAETRLESLRADRAPLELKLAATKKMKELADFSVISSCEVILDNINENTRNYLDKFFPTEGTSIVIKNASTKGVEKPKLATSIYHKGQEAKKLKSLSGGERSRAYLASQLGLSEMYNCPFLLIDEGFEGLPPDHKDELIEFLKEFAETRLVLVIEHGANEAQFQQIIRIA